MIEKILNALIPIFFIFRLPLSPESNFMVHYASVLFR